MSSCRISILQFACLEFKNQSPGYAVPLVTRPDDLDNLDLPYNLQTKRNNYSALAQRSDARVRGHPLHAFGSKKLYGLYGISIACEREDEQFIPHLVAFSQDSIPLVLRMSLYISPVDDTMHDHMHRLAAGQLRKHCLYVFEAVITNRLNVSKQCKLQFSLIITDVSLILLPQISVTDLSDKLRSVDTWVFRLGIRDPALLFEDKWQLRQQHTLTLNVPVPYANR